MQVHIVFQPDSAERLARHGALAEELGFAGIWVANMASARSPYVALAQLARETRRIRLGPAAISPFEEHPLKIAGALLALNELARGRAHILIGGGGGTLIAMGLKDARTSTFPRMVRGVRECVEFLRRAATGETADYAGELFRISGYEARWAASVPSPRIYVAANKPQMLRLAGEIADGVMLSDIDVPFLGAILAELRAGSARAGPAREGLRVNNFVAWHVKSDREASFTEARRNLWVRGIWERARVAPYLDAAECDLVQRALPAWQRAYAAGSPDIPGVAREIVERLADHLTLSGDHGDIERHIERLRRMGEAGVNEVSLRLYDDPAHSIRLIAERVLPALAARAP